MVAASAKSANPAEPAPENAPPGPAAARASTQDKMQRLSFRVEAGQARQHLEDGDWGAAVRLYSRLLVHAGHEQDPAVHAEEDIAALSGAVRGGNGGGVLLHVPPAAIAQTLLGRSAAWFGCEEYWRSYEDASSALALEACALEARAATLARTGRVATATATAPGAPPPVSVPMSQPDAPLTAATHFPATRLDGARLGLDGVAMGTAAPQAAGPTRAGGTAFQGGASAWDADGAGPATAVAPPAAAAGAGEPLDSDEEEVTGTVTSTLDRSARATPTAAADAPKKGLKKRKGRE